ncbi:hypothetical protein ACFLT9_06025 [Acidobacteriota bacterium]
MLKKNILSLLLVVAVAALFIAFMGDTDMTKAKREYIKKQWDQSGHANVASEAFVHWDEDDPRAVASGCAMCHSTEGMQQFLIDGSVHTAVDLVALEGAGKKNSIRCEACHTDENGSALRDASAVTFPGGASFTIAEPGAICMQCHQGRQSKADVDSRIAGAGNITDDTTSSRLSFRNVHYAQAAAVQMGTFAQVGYEYDGKTYDARFSHVTGYNDCVTCHDSHSTHIKEHNCTTCHTFTNLEDIRYLGSCTDYDGDGDVTEGIYYEIETLKDKVWAAFAAYTKDIVGKPAALGDGYPYFFNDTNGNGVADASEQQRTNGYSSFTPRSLRASFNIQFANKDHASYAHGGKYMIQLLYDTLEDLNSALGAGAVPMAGMHRGDEGHFDGSTEAWRHWDGDGEVPNSCAMCHSATGLAEFLATGAIASTSEHELANGMLCTTCHSGPPSMIPGATNPVTMPSGMVVSLGDTSNLCMNCHAGRGSMNTIDGKINAGAPPYTFSNIHYFPVAAIFFGTEAKGGYEYDGKNYAGRRMFPNHVGKFGTCVECHMNTKGLCDDCPTDLCDHNVAEPPAKECILCHGYDSAQPNPGAEPGAFKFSGIRPGSTPDYDGDGNMRESIEHEIKALEADLYAAIQAYAQTLGKPIIYDSHGYPYFFNDTNGNGLIDPGEATRTNAHRSFDAKLLKAAWNYHTSIKEPHGYIHNSLYVAQLLVDSIADLGGNVSAYTWR